MQQRWFVVAGLVVTAIVVAAVLVVDRPASDDRSTVIGAVDGEQGFEPDTESAATGGADPAPSSAPADDLVDERAPRVSIAPGSLTGCVVDDRGVGINGAVVSWTVVADGDITSSALAMASLATTGADGAFELRRPNGIDELSSVVWISHSSFEGLSVPLGPRAVGWPEDANWSLRSSDTRFAVVVDGGGTPIASARVEQRGTDHPLAGSLARAFVRTTTTDEAGRAALHAFSGEQRLDATAPSGATSWLGTVEADVELRIQPTFTLSGNVTLDPDVPLAAAMEVSCFEVRSKSRKLVSSSAVEGGVWGPVECAFGDAREYVVRLESTADEAEVVPFEVVVPAPAPGEDVRVGLRARAGNLAWFLVTDEADEILFDATASLSWEQDGRRVEQQYKPREDGYIAGFGCPDGQVDAYFTCPGFAPFDLAPFSFSSDEPPAFLIVLRPGGRLRGVVRAGGRPVDDFEVVVWSEALVAYAKRWEFENTGDGSFEIAGLPLGATRVVAGAAGFSPSAPLPIEVRAGEDSSIELELVDEAFARGRVVDAVTGAPLPGATIEAQYGALGETIPLTTTSTRSDADGRFEVGGVSAARPTILVRAPGFSRRQIAGAAAHEGRADLGTVRLAPAQDLRVVLSDAFSDPASCELFANGPAGSRGAAFGADGVATLPDAAAGRWMVQVMDSQRVMHNVTRELAPGEDWTINVERGGELRVEVVVVDGNQEPVEQGIVLVRRPVGEDWFSTAAHLDDSGGRLVFETRPGQLRIDVQDDAALGGNIIATRRVEFPEPGAHEVVIEVGALDRVFRVVDVDGNPIDGVKVDCYPPGEYRYFPASGLTDRDGRTTVVGVDLREVRVALQHPSLGGRFDLPVIVAPVGEVTEVVFSSGDPLVVELYHSDGPASGLRARLIKGIGGGATVTAPSDELGRVHWTSVGEGEHLVIVDEPGYWFAQVPVIAAETPILRVEVHRRCDLELEVSRQGAAARRLSLEVYREGKSIEDFLGPDLAVSSTGTLTTDDDGLLRISGLPEGSYEWHAVGADDKAATGRFELRPGTLQRVAVLL